jgi:hypothetical protein
MFIEGFSGIVYLPTALTRNDTFFVSSPTCWRLFERLKKSFISARILCQFDTERQSLPETDTSNLVIRGVLSQYDNDDDILHPVAYFSRKHSPAKINYEIYDKEFFTIMHAFKEWLPFMEGSPHCIEGISDHQNLTCFTTNH